MACERVALGASSLASAVDQPENERPASRALKSSRFEEELNSMTLLEMELIQRLQEKQREQESAYGKLEQVLGIGGGGGGRGGRGGTAPSARGTPSPAMARKPSLASAPSPGPGAPRLKRPRTRLSGACSSSSHCHPMP